MITGLIGLGAFYWALKDEKSSDATPTAPEAPEAPQDPPKALEPEGDDYRLEEAGKGDGGIISLLQLRSGLMYDDGSGGYTWSDSGYVRGSLDTGFVSAPKSLGGTISFGEYKHVLVYKTLEDAIKADEDDEPSPTKPQAPPEDKPLPPKPNKPPMPGFGFGTQSPFGGF